MTNVYREEAADPKPRLVSAEAIRERELLRQRQEQAAREGYRPAPRPVASARPVSADEARERWIRSLVEGSGQ
jgi:hypothetical protein